MPPLPIEAIREAFWDRAYYDHVDSQGISHTRDGTSIWGKLDLVSLSLSGRDLSS